MRRALTKDPMSIRNLRLRISVVPESDAEASQAIINSVDFHSFFVKGDGEMGSHLVLRGYVLMILPQVHLRNGE